MPRRRKQFPETFLPDVARAADAAMQEILDADRIARRLRSAR